MAILQLILIVCAITSQSVRSEQVNGTRQSRSYYRLPSMNYNPYLSLPWRHSDDYHQPSQIQGNFIVLGICIS